MKKTILLFFICSCFDMLSMAQVLRRPVSGAYQGLGAYSLNHMDLFSFTANEAALAQLQNIAVGLYAERRFLLSELTYYTAATGIPTTYGNFGLMVDYSGFNAYNETRAGLAFGRKLGNKIDIGARFNYNGIRIPAYGTASSISVEIGSIVHVTDKLHAGIHASNPVGGKFGSDHTSNYREEKLSSVYSFGMGYDASKKFLVSAEIQKEEDQPVNVNAGIQYKFIKLLLTRIGLSTSTSSGWLGVGVMFGSFRLDITAGYHPQLGVTPGMLLLFNFNKAAK